MVSLVTHLSSFLHYILVVCSEKHNLLISLFLCSFLFCIVYVENQALSPSVKQVCRSAFLYPLAHMLGECY